MRRASFCWGDPVAVTLPICQWRRKPNQQLDAAGQRSKAVSRHHILPPIIYTPAPPKPKKTERRRGVWSVKGKGAADEADATEETGDTSHAAPTRNASPPSQHSPIEATERRVHSTTGNLSEGTLKAMLEVQEQESAKGDGGGAVVTKD
jgi:hypothetical protein